MENQTIINTSIIALIVLIGTFTYVGQVDEAGTPIRDPTHYCEDRGIKYNCDSLRKYYQLYNGKCLNNITGNKLCRSGWEEIPSSLQNYHGSKGDWICPPRPEKCYPRE